MSINKFGVVAYIVHMQCQCPSLYSPAIYRKPSYNVKLNGYRTEQLKNVVYSSSSYAFGAVQLIIRPMQR